MLASTDAGNLSRTTSFQLGICQVEVPTRQVLRHVILLRGAYGKALPPRENKRCETE